MAEKIDLEDFEEGRGSSTSLKGTNGMGKDFKYKMRHIGDAFADQVENLGHAAKGSVRGITLAYNIDGLEKEKTKIITRIGEEMASAGKVDPTFNISEHDARAELLSKLDRIEGRIETLKKERKKRLHPETLTTNGSPDAL